MKKKQLIKLNDFDALQRVIRTVNSLPLGDEWEVEIRPATVSRSINQNDLMWMWLDKLAKHFSSKDKKYTKNDIYCIVVHKFLGYETITIGKTTIKDQLKSTKDLCKEDFYHFMVQIDEWALSLGCQLPSPDSSQYRKMKDKNEK